MEAVHPHSTTDVREGSVVADHHVDTVRIEERAEVIAICCHDGCPTIGGRPRRLLTRSAIDEEDPVATLGEANRPQLHHAL